MFVKIQKIWYNQKYKCIEFTCPNAVDYNHTFLVEIYY